ncbi:MAG: lysoplasmalogenase family protein [Flavobacterium sp.]|nr:lysoplasmalogenase family protein [Flavobacterium sp.]
MNLSILKNKLTYLYVLVAIVLAIGVTVENKFAISFTRPTLLPILILIYWFSSKKRDVYYLVALIFAAISNIVLMFEADQFLLYAVLFFLFFRFLTFILVIKYTIKIRLLPIMLGTMPFLAILFYCILLTEMNLGDNFFPSVFNAILISMMAGIAVSNYYFEEDLKNTLLLISTILFTVLIFVFVIENFYMEILVFQTIRTICFSIGHYLFFKYIILAEKSNND